MDLELRAPVTRVAHHCAGVSIVRSSQGKKVGQRTDKLIVAAGSHSGNLDKLVALENVKVLSERVVYVTVNATNGISGRRVLTEVDLAAIAQVDVTDLVGDTLGRGRSVPIDASMVFRTRSVYAAYQVTL